MNGQYQSIYRRFKPDVGNNEGTKKGCVINEVYKEQEIFSTVSLSSSQFTHTDYGLTVGKFNSACLTSKVLEYAGEQRDGRKMYVRNRKGGAG